MISRCVQDVKLVNVPSDAVKFPVEIFNSGCVLVIKSLIQKPRDDGCLPNFSGAQNHHPVTILSRNVKVTLRRRHLFNHACSCSRYCLTVDLNPRVVRSLTPALCLKLEAVRAENL